MRECSSPRHVTCHMSYITCHVSHVTCHISHVIFFLLLFRTKCSGEAYWRRVCYQRGLPRLVFDIFWRLEVVGRPNLLLRITKFKVMFTESAIFVYIWLLLATVGYFWLLLATFSYFCLLLFTFGYFCLLLDNFC